MALIQHHPSATVYSDDSNIVIPNVPLDIVKSDDSNATLEDEAESRILEVQSKSSSPLYGPISPVIYITQAKE